MRLGPAGVAATAAVVCGLLGLRSLGSLLDAAPEHPAVRWRSVVASAVAVSTLEGTVHARRGGRVAVPHAAPGDAVDAGDALVEFEDLALARSRADLRREIEELRAAGSSARREPADGAGSEAHALRLAALRGVEEAYEAARKDFERTKALHEGGLVARLEYEREQRDFAAAGVELQAARATAERREWPSPGLENAAALPALRRAQQLSRRLERLPPRFVVASPWDGTVRELHVRAGDMPARGAPLATLARAAVPRLEASVAGVRGIVRVDSACDVPGPLPFALQGGVLSLLAPSPHVRPGDRCDVTLRVVSN